MVDSSLPFASALLALGDTPQKQDAFLGNFEFLETVFKENPELENWLAHPAVSNTDKERLLLEITQDCTPVFQDFLKIVCRHSMSGSLMAMAADYRKLLDEARGIENVTVTSAAPLDEEQKARLAAALEHKLNHKVRLLCEVDPSIIAGMKIRTEQNVLDASYAGQLEKMKEQLRRS